MILPCEENKLESYIKNNRLVLFENVIESDKVNTEQGLKLSVSGMLDEYLSDKKNEFNKATSRSINQPCKEHAGVYRAPQLRRYYI